MFIKRHLLPIMVVLIYMAITVDWLNATLTPDEAATYLLYAQSPIVALFGYTLPNNHLANSLLIWITTSLMGGSELAIRLPAYFVALMAVCAVYRMGHRLGGVWAALSAVVILTTTTTFAHYVLQARGNTLAVWLCTMLIYAALYHRPRSQRWFGYGVIAMAAFSVLALPSNILLNGAIGLWALRFRPKIIAPLIVGTALGSMFYGSMLMYEGMVTTMAGRFGMDSVPALANDLYGTFSLVPYSVIGVALALLVGLYVMRRERRFMWLIAAIFLVPLILAPIQFILTDRFFFGRNYLYLAGIIAPLAGLGIRSIFRHNTPILLAVWLIVTLPLRMSHPKHDPFTANVLTLIDERVAPEQAVILVGCCYADQFFYYRPDAALYDVVAASRLYVIPTALESFDQMLANHSLDVTCTPIDTDLPEAYLCERIDP